MSVRGTMSGVAAAIVCLVLAPRVASAQPQTVNITIPAGVSFLVSDVSVSTPGSPSTTQISFDTVTNFGRNDNVRISVRADSTTFSGPGTTRIAASRVSWTATASTGSAQDGTLSATAFRQVYTSPRQPTSGSVDLSWTLGAITAAGLRAGTHTLTVRWRIESQ